MRKPSVINASDALDARYGMADRPWADCADLDGAVASRGSVCKFTPEPIDIKLVRSLCAMALSAPSKSDLQGRDIVII
jgi:hypothetical protein